VGVVEADLDTHLTIGLVLVCDAPLPQGALGVAAAALQTHVPHAGVVRQAGGVAPAGEGGPHTPVLGVWLPVTGNT